MKLRITWIISIIAITALAACKRDKPDPEKPNIVFILADDLSYRDLSCYGQKLYKTPNLDKLAAEGLVFNHAYSAAPECAPARGSLMTGLHTGHGTVRRNSSARGQDHLMDEDVTIAEELKKLGYATGFMGKWGIGQPGTEGVPYKQGFDYAFGYYDQVRAHTFFPEYLWENDRKVEYPGNVGFDIQRRYNFSRLPAGTADLNVYDEKGKLVLDDLPDPEKAVYSQAEVDKAAIRFLDKNKEQPFFLYYAPQLPHGPVIVDDFSPMMDLDTIPQLNREWAAMVIRLDKFIGELISRLKELGVYENTIIFFASDNGYSQCGYMPRNCGRDWPDDPWFHNKGPFTGGKFSVLEGGIRVPFFVHWPGKIKPGDSDETVWLPDFFPTAVELAGGKMDRELDGQSLIEALFGGEFKGHESLYFSKNREEAVRLRQFKAYRPSPDDPIKLYDVVTDTYGEKDLSAKYPEVVEEVKAIMEKEYVPSEWYWNPAETREEFQAKQKKAESIGEKLPVLRPNGLEKLPWE